MIELDLGKVKIGPKHPLTLISGPCVIESEALALSTAKTLKALTKSLGIQLIYKSSYDKANRSSIHSFRGPGINKGLEILRRVKEEFDVPVTTDIHAPEEAKEVSEICDLLQIPAFLSRQTDLLVAAAETGAGINVKKGQFMAPWDMENVVLKIRSTGNNKILLTDRGTSFGYNNLVSDFRSIPIMHSFGAPVCFDATHSVQLPGGKGTSSGGQSQFIPTLAKAAVAVGCSCIFLESHPEPEKALSDKDSVISYGALPALLEELVKLYHVVQGEYSCSVSTPL